LRYNLNWWTASSRKTKKTKRIQSRKRTTQNKKKKLQKLFHTTKEENGVETKRRSSKVHHLNQTRWCGDRRKCSHPRPLLRAWMYLHQAKSKKEKSPAQ